MLLQTGMNKAPSLAVTMPTFPRCDARLNVVTPGFGGDSSFALGLRRRVHRWRP